MDYRRLDHHAGRRVVVTGDPVRGSPCKDASYECHLICPALCCITCRPVSCHAYESHVPFGSSLGLLQCDPVLQAGNGLLLGFMHTSISGEITFARASMTACSGSLPSAMAAALCVATPGGGGAPGISLALRNQCGNLTSAAQPASLQS